MKANNMAQSDMIDNTKTKTAVNWEKWAVPLTVVGAAIAVITVMIALHLYSLGRFDAIQAQIHENHQATTNQIHEVDKRVVTMETNTVNQGKQLDKIEVQLNSLQGK